MNSLKIIFMLLLTCGFLYLPLHSEPPAVEIEAAAHSIELYYIPACPYCQKVIRVLNQKGISIPLKNISLDKQAHMKLVQLTGKKQVPCLVIDGEPLLESDEIIRWINANLYQPL